MTSAAIASSSSAATRCSLSSPLSVLPSASRRLLPCKRDLLPPPWQRLTPSHCHTRLRAAAFSTTASVGVSGDHRSLLSLSGRDTYKLLQGLVTNDVRVLEKQVESRVQAEAAEMVTSPPAAFFCAFLNPQGRLISTAFLYPHPAATPEEPHVIIDCHAENKDSLLAIIKRFKLRSKVRVSEMQQGQDEGWRLLNFWAGETPSARSADVQVFRDARTPNMGHRVILPSSAALSLTLPTSSQSTTSYGYHRLTEGVPDGPQELVENQALPLEANLDLMHGVDFRKGCYVGQELTARTHYTGVVRKRIMPVRLYPPNGQKEAEPIVGGDLRAPSAPSTSDREEGRSRKTKSAGKLLSCLANEGTGNPSHIGLASLRLALLPTMPFEQGGWLTMQSPNVGDADEWKVEAVWPKWWPEGLRADFTGGSETSAS